MIRRPPRSTQSRSSAASDVYKRQTVDNREEADQVPCESFRRVIVERHRYTVFPDSFFKHLAGCAHLVHKAVNEPDALERGKNGHEQVAERRAWLKAHRHLEKRQVALSCDLRELSTTHHRHDRGASLKRPLNAIEGLLRVARVADGEYQGIPVSYTHLRAHETRHDLVCRLLLEKKKTT